MDRTSIRAWRRIQKKRVWYKRLRLVFRAFSMTYVEILPTGEMQEAETWKDLRKARWCQAYRTTRQPCSCPMCSGARYNRVESKQDAIRDICEQFED